MKAYEIKLGDLQRLFVGEVPSFFYLELIFRVLLIYFLLLVSMRLMGKRMSSQLSRNEMAAVASLAAAVGIPLMNPDKGLLPAILTAGVIIVYQILIARKAFKSKRFESLTQDSVSTLVQDGMLCLKAMVHNRISRERLFAQLRSKEISHLGMVKRLYFEAGGNFSLLKAPVQKAGLSNLPDGDQELEREIHRQVSGYVCLHCGNPFNEKATHQQVRCDNCSHMEWTSAVIRTEVKTG